MSWYLMTMIMTVQVKKQTPHQLRHLHYLCKIWGWTIHERPITNMAMGVRIGNQHHVIMEGD